MGLFSKKHSNVQRRCKSLLSERDLLYAIDTIRDRSETTVQFAQQLIPIILKNTRLDDAYLYLSDQQKSAFHLYSSQTALTKTREAVLTNLIKASLDKGKPIATTIDKLPDHYAKELVDRRSIVIYPIILNGHKLGAIAGSSKRHVFRSDIATLRIIVSQADSALMHLKDKEEMTLRLRQVNLTERIDTLRDSSKNLDSFLEGLLKEIQSQIPSLEAYIYVYNDNTADLDLAVHELHTQPAVTTAQLKKLAYNSLVENSTIFTDNQIIIPLILHRKSLAVFILQRKTQGTYTKEDKELLDTIIAQADSAIEHLKTIQQLNFKTKELDTLYKIDKIRDEDTSFDVMLDEILKQIISVLNAKTGFIMLFDENKKSLDLKVQSPKSTVSKTFMNTLAERAIKEKELIQENEISTDVHSALAIPLVLHERIIGVFGAVNSSVTKHFGREERTLLQAIASQADTAIFEDFEREKIKSMFKRYVDDSVVDKLLKEDPESFMKGKRRFMSVLFADIRGFTAYSESLSPQELVRTINDYLSDMTDVIMKYKGTLDKFVGDEVMALFGAPIRMKKHATTAVEAAIDMQKAMKKLQKKWETYGKYPLGIGIGINTGYMVAGNIGCEKMSDYTVLGDNVNLSCRICNMAPKDTIYITDKTKRQLKKEGSSIKTKKLDPIQIRGKRKKVQLYEVIY